MGARVSSPQSHSTKQPSEPTHRALILDLGDVIFNWKAPTDGKLSPKTLSRAMSTLPWNDFERGQISETECFQRIGEILSVSPSDIAETIKQAEISLKYDDRLVSTLGELKNDCGGGLRIYAMSNIAKPHYEIIRSKDWEWSLFDQVFTSADAGMRKPDLNFYEYVLEAIGLEHCPQNVVFVDDKRENVLSALSLGMRAIRFEDTEKTIEHVLNIFGDPVKRGEEYLQRNAKNMHCMTDNGIVIKENFAQLLILEATGDRELITLKSYPLLWNFFQEQPVLTTNTYPNDFDTTSLALTILGCTDPVAKGVMDKAVKNISYDGIVQLYDDPQRPRVDAVICVHILTLFYLHGRGGEVRKTYDWVYHVLLHRAYLDGTLYYCSPDYFLYALNRLITYTHQAGKPIPSDLFPLFKERCKERIGATGDALAISMRLIACHCAGIPVSEAQSDLCVLKTLQCQDGGWPFCGMYRIPSAKTVMGNRGVGTAMAVKAIKLFVD
ncbi:hypothetical protein D9756_010513 [Leucocoprinus leucothites]|uniref:HAD-like protein n=1 Tax=Leucocoprinus leucothites TaxID=201217 RepID=A0A8H5CVU2_9AGAR|nr:hypothetical protein D9756_010513 [Leucoagaricus leucothites]